MSVIVEEESLVLMWFWVAERVRDTVRETQGLVEAFTNDQFLRGAVADEEETILLS